MAVLLVYFAFLCYNMFELLIKIKMKNKNLFNGRFVFAGGTPENSLTTTNETPDKTPANKQLSENEKKAAKAAVVAKFSDANIGKNIA